MVGKPEVAPVGPIGNDKSASRQEIKSLTRPYLFLSDWVALYL